MTRLLPIVAFLGAALVSAGVLSNSAQAHDRSLHGQRGGQAVAAIGVGERHSYDRQARRTHKDDRQGYRRGQDGGYRGGYKADGGHRGKVYKYDGRKRRHAYRDDRRHYGHRHGRHLGRGHGGYAPAAACHPVRKHVFDRQGYRKLVHGVMCYDAYGRPYIARGSRYVSHY